jgi:hypothetical protein
MSDRHKDRPSKLRRWRVLFFWALFGVGLLLDVWGPRLQIKDNEFVGPPLVAGSDFQPLEAVRRDKRIRLLAAALTLSGAIGLAFSYREVLFGRRSAPPDLVDGGDAASNNLPNSKVTTRA